MCKKNLAMECFFVCPILGNLSTWVAIPYSFMYWPVLKFLIQDGDPYLFLYSKLAQYWWCSLFNLFRQKVNNINLSYSGKIIHSHKECIRTAINFKIKSLWKKSYPPPLSITISFEKTNLYQLTASFFVVQTACFRLNCLLLTGKLGSSKKQAWAMMSGTR